MSKDTVDPVTLNKPRLERTEAVISAKEILEELDKHSSDRAPEYGLYLMKIAGQKTKLYGLQNEDVIVRAEQILHYTEKGFTPTVSPKTLDGRSKLEILKEKGMTERHDTVPVREPDSFEMREPHGKNTEAIEGAKRGPKSKADADEDVTATSDRIRTVTSVPPSPFGAPKKDK